MVKLFNEFFDEWIIPAVPSEQFDQSLDTQFFGNLKNPLVCILIKLLSMEHTLYQTLNNATRLHEEDKIDTLGPYAFALYHSIALVENP